MNDLRKLVGSSTESDLNARSAAQAPTNTAALRDLVGASDAVSDDARIASESSQLRALVGERTFDSSTSRSQKLTDLTGVPASAPAPGSPIALSVPIGGSRPASSPDPRATLSTLVGAGGESAKDVGWQAPELAQVGKRPIFNGRRKAGAVNYLSLAAAVLAVVAIVGTASFAVVQRATANPADDAMVSLREREAELANDTKVLQTAADLYDASVREATSLAQNSESVLAALEGRVDGTALAEAQAARGTLLQVAAMAVAVSVPEYQRASIDEESLADVGKAIDGVRLARESLPTLITDARDARSQVSGAVSAFRTELSDLGSAIESEANKLVVENDSAAQSFRAAVTDAAGRVTAAQQAGGDGLAEMPVYAAAVDALRAENQRVLRLEDEIRNSTPVVPAPRNPGTGGSNSGGSSNSGSENTGGGSSGDSNGGSDAGSGGNTGGGNTGGGTGDGSGNGSGEGSDGGSGGGSGGDSDGGSGETPSEPAPIPTSTVAP
ncbi:hypothetical protein [Microbacterium hydrothermale]|uniref:hypothetical protein n=1 Tax=Microbacterium hydrothermale TaxID=857427 RepID=UPI0010A7F4A8|nr:hypothetical protein [Microbacterium hydrothermale]